MTTIALTEGPEITLVNVFTVAPENQDALLAALDQATAEVFAAVPGFVSANLHASLDGTRVINYAQWASEEAYQEAMRRDDVRAHVKGAAGLARGFDPTIVRVRAIHAARD